MCEDAVLLILTFRRDEFYTLSPLNEGQCLHIYMYTYALKDFSRGRRTLGPFIYVLDTRPRQNVLETSSRYASVQIASTVKCSRYPFVQIYNRHTSRSVQYDLLCLHCATCEVLLTCTLRADSGLPAKPRPIRTCSRFHIVQTAFRRRTKGVICSENMVWSCSSWNCSSGKTTL